MVAVTVRRSWPSTPEIGCLTPRRLVGQQWRHRVADLGLNRVPLADELVVVGEREEPSQLGDAEPTVLPVEWSDVRARLSLDRR